MQSLATVHHQDIIIKECNIPEQKIHHLLTQGVVAGMRAYVKQNVAGNIILEFYNMNLAIGSDISKNIVVEVV